MPKSKTHTHKTTAAWKPSTREVTIAADLDLGPFAVHAESDQAAIQRVIAEHLIPLRDARALKGRVVIRCGGARHSMRAG